MLGNEITHITVRFNQKRNLWEVSELRELLDAEAIDAVKNSKNKINNIWLPGEEELELSGCSKDGTTYLFRSYEEDSGPLFVMKKTR